MTDLIIEFGAESIDGVKHAIETAVGTSDYLVSITTAKEVESLEYSETRDDLKSAAEKIRLGIITSILLHPKDSSISWALLNAPHFLGEPRMFWYGAVDYKALRYETLFDNLLQVEELQFLSVSVEEGLELNAENFSASTFPWNYSQLIVGAVRDRSSTTNNWIRKRGPAWYQIR